MAEGNNLPEENKKSLGMGEGAVEKKAAEIEETGK
jgi:hypothetical protein